MKKLLIASLVCAVIFSCKKDEEKVIEKSEVQHIVVDFAEVLNDTTALSKVVFNFSDGRLSQAIIKNTLAYYPILISSRQGEITSIIVEKVNINTLSKSLYRIDEQITLSAGMKPVKLNVKESPSV